jgi:hypothetical protein
MEYFRGMSPRPSPRDLRASDADRDRVLALLSEAMSDGRLTADEHAERVQRAFSARTLGELAELTTDLAVPSAQPVKLDGGRVVVLAQHANEPRPIRIACCQLPHTLPEAVPRRVLSDFP